MSFLILLIFFLLYLAAPGYYLAHVLPLTLVKVSALLFLFLNTLGKKIAILEILPLMAIVLYLLSPSLSYYLVDVNLYEGHQFMPISAYSYFSVALPGVLAIGLGVHFPAFPPADHQKIITSVKEQLIDQPDLAKKIILIGFAGFVLKPFAPGFLALVFQFASELVVIGSLILYFTKNNSAIALVIISVFLLSKAISGGMFGELVFWGLLVAIFIFIKHKFSLFFKIACFVLGFLAILLIQSVKGDYRTIIWDDSEQLLNQSKLELFLNLMESRLSNRTEYFTPLTLSGMFDRFNQGYLTAYAIEHTPEYEPYARGETIFLASLGAFIPRVLWPDKPQAGGMANMARFTSLEVSPGTSMNIGQLGDAYVNFGIAGGALFLLFYGFIFKGVFELLIRYSKNRPVFIFWLPLIFSAVIIVETDVLTAFNHVVKAMIFIGLIKTGLHFFNLAIFPKATSKAGQHKDKKRDIKP